MLYFVEIFLIPCRSEISFLESYFQNPSREMEHETLIITPPPSGRLIAPIWTQWALSPRFTKDIGSYADNSKQHEKDGPLEGSKINEFAPASTEPDTPISKGSPCLSENYAHLCTYLSYRTKTSQLP
jgi:hypothetical protein